MGEGRYNWLATKGPYSCVIASPKKEAKFKGLKSFIAYQLTPSVSFFLLFSRSRRRNRGAVTLFRSVRIPKYFSILSNISFSDITYRYHNVALFMETCLKLRESTIT